MTSCGRAAMTGCGGYHVANLGLAFLVEEVVEDDDGQALDTAEVGVVGDEEGAIGPESRLRLPSCASCHIGCSRVR